MLFRPQVMHVECLVVQPSHRGAGLTCPTLIHQEAADKTHGLVVLVGHFIRGL